LAPLEFELLHGAAPAKPVSFEEKRKMVADTMNWGGGGEDDPVDRRRIVIV
jgi:hypothetical protein